MKQPLIVMLIGQSGLGMSSFLKLSVASTNATILEERWIGITKNGEDKILQTKPVPNEGNEELSVYKEVTIEYGEAKSKVIFLDFLGFLEEPTTRDLSPIVEMTKKRFASYLESSDIEFIMRMKGRSEKIERKKIDNRIHCCIYFTSPDGIDVGEVKSIKGLSEVVNLVPVIGRSDSFTEEDRQLAKKSLAKVLDENEIVCYGNTLPAPQKNDPESEKFIEEFSTLTSKMPFSVITLSEKIIVDEISTFGRQLPWGLINSKEEKISDLEFLINMVMYNNSEDLKSRTNDVIYEDYRTLRIARLKKSIHIPLGK